ncbi:MAG: hypothetical protein N2C14_11270 [Planctomycetales bacterium]
MDCVPLALPVLEWTPRSEHWQSQWHTTTNPFSTCFREANTFTTPRDLSGKQRLGIVGWVGQEIAFNHLSRRSVMEEQRGLLIALDSVGIDPLGHDRDESVYSESRFLFPRGRQGDPLEISDGPIPGALVATDVAEGRDQGAIECDITYASIFSGQSALSQHGLMQGLGLNHAVLESLISESNLFQILPESCLANAIFPANLDFLGTTYTTDLVPCLAREEAEAGLRLRDESIRFTGKDRRGLPELFTACEINQNVFVHAARQAGLRLSTWDDVRDGEALTASMTHELENEFNLDFLGQDPLPNRSPEEAGRILAKLAERHRFTFYKYQLADMVSHAGKVESARAVFAIIERFLNAVLEQVDPRETLVVVTSDHGHLEQVEFTMGHPKSLVPTWCFGLDAVERASALRRPENIFHLFAGLAAVES